MEFIPYTVVIRLIVRPSPISVTSSPKCYGKRKQKFSKISVKNVLVSLPKKKKKKKWIKIKLHRKDHSYTKQIKKKKKKKKKGLYILSFVKKNPELRNEWEKGTIISLLLYYLQDRRFAHIRNFHA